jgi:hypothetical protein
MEVEQSANVKSSSGSEEYDDEIKKNNKRKRKNKQSKTLNSDDEDDKDKKSTRIPRSKKPNNNKEIDTMFNKENKSEITSSNGTHQKKQWVTKTYTDKDGYTVTEKVMEMVDCSGEEAVQEAKVDLKETKSFKKQVSSILKIKFLMRINLFILYYRKNEPQTKPKATNQATLMSFFKKN